MQLQLAILSAAVTGVAARAVDLPPLRVTANQHLVTFDDFPEYTYGPWGVSEFGVHEEINFAGRLGRF